MKQSLNRVIGPIAILLVALLFPALSRAQDSGSFRVAQASAGNRVALVIGNASYPHDDRPLPQPIKDARAIADELRRAGFDVITGEDLTNQRLRAALTNFRAKIKPGSVALIFFSGYAIQTGKQSYVIPVDAQIWTEGEVKRDGISIESMLAEADAAGATVKLVIVDAARRNPFERRFRGSSIGLAPLTAPPGTLAMYSAAPDSVAHDSGGENSLFVTELLKEMRPGLSAQAIFNSTQKGVSQASKNERVPWVSSSLVQDFYFGKGPAPLSSEPKTSFAEPPQKKQEVTAIESIRPELPKLDTPPKIDPPKPERPKADTPPKTETAAKIEPLKSDAPAKTEMAAKIELPKTDTPPKIDSSKPEPELSVPPEVKKTSKPVDRDNVIKALDEQLRRNPQDAEAFYKRGQAWAMRREYGLANEDFGEAIRINPNDAESLNNRCFTRAVVGELEGALADCNEAVRLRPGYADALDSRGLTQLKLGQYDAAIADFTAALRINAKMASALYGRGKAKIGRGDKAGGNADIRAAKAIDSTIDREFEGYGVR